MPATGGWLTALIFLPPALTLFTLFIIMPISEAAWYSLYNWNGLGAPTRFIGLDNFAQLFGIDVIEAVPSGAGPAEILGVSGGSEQSGF